MNYVQFHVGDWDSSTRLLSPLEKGIYIDLLMLYYSLERPLMRSECERISRAYAPNEKIALKYVLDRFFHLEGEVYSHRRCDEEIAKAAEKSEKAAKSAKARWNKAGKGSSVVNSAAVAVQKECKRSSDAYADGMRMHSERSADGMLTNNQEPITNINKVGGAFSEKVADAPDPPPSDFCDEIPEEPFPEDWGALEPLPPPETKPAKKEKRGTRLDLKELPEPWERWAEEKAPDLDPKAAFEEFRNYWIAVPGAKGVKLDWFATFRNSVLSMPDWKRKTFRKKTEADKVKPASFEEIQAIIRGDKQLRKDENYGQA